jgi:hypothetical protein
MIAFDLRSFTFVIPEFSEEDWREAVEGADGIEKLLLATQSQTVSLVKLIKDIAVTPARLAWVNLWTRCFSLIDGAYVAMSGNSTFAMEVLERIAIETFMHIHTIVEPIAKSGRNGEEMVIDRLNAYSAWTLGEDMRSAINLSQESSLNMVWDPSPARDIKNNPEKREAHEALFGEITIETDPDSLKAGRQQQQAELITLQRRLGAWLSHSDLARWKKKVRMIETDPKRPKRMPVSFFELFNIDEKTMAKKMYGCGLGLGYIRYQQTSMLIHGTTIEQMNLTLADKIVPKIRARKDEVESSAESIRSSCNRTILYLAMTAKLLWP